MAIKKINTVLQIEAGLLDGDGNSGNSNQILISTGTGIDWVDGSGSSIIGGPYLPLSAGASYPLTGDLLTSGNIYLNNNKTIFGKNTSGSSYGLLTITSGNVIKLGAYAYTSAATQIGLGDNGSFLIGSSTVMKIDSSGNVGIGTSPGEKLDVAGNIRLSGNVINASNTAYYLDLDGTSRLNHGIFTSTLSFGNFSTGIQGTLFEGYSTHSVVRTDSARLDFYMGKTTTGVGTMMSLTDTGRVGIGTTSPAAPLHVDLSDVQVKFQLNNLNSGFDGILVDGTNASYNLKGGNGDEYGLIVLNDGSFRIFNPGVSGYGFTMTNTGRFGLSNTVPTQKLDVNGNIKLSNNSQLMWRNAANNADIPIVQLTSSNQLNIGTTSSSVPTVVAVHTSSAERMRIDSNGNVGIGTTSPGSKLEVRGDSGSSALLSLISDSGTPNDAFMRFYDEGGGGAYSVGIDSSDEKFKIAFDYDGDSLTTGTKLVMDTSGRVGIGTTSPGAKLTIEGGDDNSSTGVLELRTTGGTNLKIGGNTNYSFIQSHSSKPLYINQLGNNVIINSSSGRVGIGTGSPGEKLEVSGNVKATNFILSSDASLKEDIKDLNVKVDAKWRSYKFKDSKETRYGVIAQELEETNPELVKTDEEGLKSVKYIDLLIAKIAELEARLEKAGL